MVLLGLLHPSYHCPALNAVVFCVHSLLDILADRKGGGGITGDIIVNGEPRPKNFRYASGYVPQVGLIFSAMGCMRAV